MSRSTLAVSSLMALMLAACANGDGITSLATMRDANDITITATTAGLSKAVPWPTADWWRSYQDEQLSQLILEGLGNNPSLKGADARIRRAAAVAGLADSRLYPQVSGSAEAILQRFTENGLYPPPFAGATRTANRIGLDGGYPLDLWGGQEAEFKAALGGLHASALDGQAARLDLASAIAQAYVRLSGEFDQLDISHDLLRQKQDIKSLSERLVGAGLVTEVENQQAAAAIAATQADMAGTEERIALARQELAALLGAGPDRGQTIQRPRVLLSSPIGLPSDLPAELVGRRPDIVAQRWRIEAALKSVDAARAEFYPNINLTAFLVFQSVGLDQLLKGGSGVFGVGPAITLPIFDADRLRSNLARADADVDVLVERYNGTVVSALQDVVGQLTSWRFNQATLEQQRIAVTHLNEAYRLAVLRYRDGLTNYLTVLSAEGDLIAARRKEAAARNRQYVISIALIHALGGGLPPENAPRS